MNWVLYSLGPLLGRIAVRLFGGFWTILAYLLTSFLGKAFILAIIVLWTGLSVTHGIDLINDLLLVMLNGQSTGVYSPALSVGGFFVSLLRFEDIIILYVNAYVQAMVWKWVFGLITTRA